MSGRRRRRFGLARPLCALFASVALASGLVLARDRSPGPPRPAAIAEDAGGPVASAQDAGPAGAAGEALEVTLRLVDVLGDATIEAPGLEPALQTMRAHWRRMKPAFVRSTPTSARLLTTIALRTSAQETQASMSLGAGKAWRPDARVWNMNEGSFDQRDAIVAPVGATYTFDVDVPLGGVLVASTGTVNATRATTVFTVSTVGPSGARRELCVSRVPPSQARRWNELRCDLAPVAGSKVSLSLGVKDETPTAADLEVAPPPKPSPRKPPQPAPDGADAGAPAVETLSRPGAPVAALWGNPMILGRRAPRLAKNVLFIVVDALRPDVIASMHDDADDARARAARLSPLEARLPKIEGLTPNIDALAARGVRFTSAYSAACWTRPGTLAMLAGARSSELGIDTLQWAVRPPQPGRFYAGDPPLLPLLARRRGAIANAFVNNYFMVGYAAVGVDMGFDRVDDHRYRTRDTLEITRAATEWLRANRDARFFAFVNYNSPHEPYEPPPEHLARVPAPPEGPKDPAVRMYMAEAAKDDEAIGVLLRTLGELGLTESTIVVLTADHGETLSSAHTGTSLLDRMPIRYHHAVSNFEETTRVPIIIAAPGLLPAGGVVRDRVRTTDIAPTVAELVGAEVPPRMSGRSLTGLARGNPEPARVVVSEGRGSRAILFGRYRLVVREGKVRTTIRAGQSRTVAEELFDLEDDPGERQDIAPSRPDLVKEMKARLTAELAGVAPAGTPDATAAAAEHAPMVRLRFGGAGRARRVSGTLVVGTKDAPPKSVRVTPVELGQDAVRVDGARVEISFVTSPDAIVGVDLAVEPAGAPVAWDLYLDDAAWPVPLVHGGPWGFAAPALLKGVGDDASRAAAAGTTLPYLDPHRDEGLFVLRNSGAEPELAQDANDEGAEELARLLREWGYAHGNGGDAGAPR